MKRILCIWLPHWPLQRLLVARPELSARPLVLYQHDARRGQQVAFCNQAASQRGIRAGMRLTDAQALMPPTMSPAAAASNVEPTSPGQRPLLQVLLHDPQADRHALSQLAGWCEQFSPLVGIEEDPGPQSLLLDVTGLADLFGGEQQLAGQLVGQLDRRGYRADVVIADTVGAAWAISHFGFPDGSAPPLSGRLRIIASAHTQAALDPLPLPALRLPRGAIEVLAQLGITRVEQLRRLPRAAVATRLGPQIAHRLDQALGVLEEVIVAHRPAPPFAARCSLEYPTAHRSSLDQLIWQLVQQVAHQLAQQQQGAIQVVCSLHCGRPSPVGIRLGLFQPTSDPQHLMNLIRMQLELLVVPGAVEQVQLEVPATGKLQQRQGELFAATPAAQPRQLALLVDQLSSRLGPQQVVRAQLQPSANPEWAYRYVPLAGQTASKSPSPSATTLPVPQPGHRPLRCYIPPLPIQVVSVVPDGSPAAVHYRGRHLTLSYCWGPERIETQWWRGPTVRRDYFRVQTDGGQRFWIFRRLQDQSWFLQGEFE
jgi:protein ImuB